MTSTTTATGNERVPTSADNEFMAPARDTGVRRGRGGFYRRGDDAPYVSDPSGAIVKTGTRAGKPKWLLYGSPSSRGKQIENAKALEKWGERRTVFGIGRAPELVDLCRDLADLDVDTDQYRRLADKIITAAKGAADASLSADRGTFAHTITEDHDLGRDPAVRIPEGEQLGFDPESQAGIITAWAAMLADSGLEILVSEASCVDDRWRLAGTLDNLARTTRPLRFVLPTGEVREIPAGVVVVLDKKSGRRRRDTRTGAVLGWQSYAIQLASYAQSLRYDTEQETREAWPWPIDQSHALIAHIDVLGAIEGRPGCDLVYVDLVAGRDHGGECADSARRWEHRTDVFSVSRIAGADEEPVRVPDRRPHAAATDPGDGLVAAARRDHLRERCWSLAEHKPSAAEWLKRHWPDTLPETIAECVTADQLDAVEALVTVAETQSSAPFVGGDPLNTPGVARGELAEGADADPGMVGLMASKLMSEVPGEVLIRFRDYADQAREAGGSISLGDRPSLRRWEIARALYYLGKKWNPFTEGFLIEALQYVGCDHTPVGVALAHVDVRAAEVLAEICVAYDDGSLTVVVDMDSGSTWTAGDRVFAV